MRNLEERIGQAARNVAAQNFFPNGYSVGDVAAQAAACLCPELRLLLRARARAAQQAVRWGDSVHCPPRYWAGKDAKAVLKALALSETRRENEND